MQESTDQARDNRDREIDLVAMAGKLWKARKTLITSMLICSLLGIGWYVYKRFVAQPEYESDTILLIEPSSIADEILLAQSEDNRNGKLKISIASDSIPGELYPLIITSDPFLKQLLQIEVNDPISGRPVILSDLLTRFAPGSDALTLLKNGLTIESEVSHTLHIRLTLPRTKVVTAVTDSLASLLSPYLTGFATKKAFLNMHYISLLQSQANTDAEKALKEISDFHDRKSKQLLENRTLEEKRLQANWKIAYERQVFLSREAEKARYRLQAATPSVTVIQPASAAKRTKLPNLMLILLASVLTGFIIGSGILFLKKEAE